MPTPDVDPAQRARLLAMKLAALVRDHGVDTTGFVADAFAPGAAFVVGRRAWVLADNEPWRALGPAVAWALRHDADAVSLLVERDSGLLARRAAGFDLSIDVWHVEGRVLLPAVAEPLPDPAPVPDHHLSLVDMIVSGGATAVIEHGVLSGEVRGLEVCRVVDDPHSGTTRLEVGIGAHDREAFQLLHGDRPAVESLAEVVATVAEHRADGATPHPLNRLAPERLLRARLQEHPDLIGATRVEPVAPPTPRRNVKDSVPCAASAEFAGGERVGVAVAGGIDLDLVPFAVDVALASGVDEVVLPAAARDLVGVQREVAALARVGLRLVAVDTP